MINLIMLFFGQNSQFEDVSSPEKQTTAPRFAIRSLRNPSTKRFYRELDEHSTDDENAPTPRRTPAGRGRMFASLDLNQPSSPGSDFDHVPSIPAASAVLNCLLEVYIIRTLWLQP